MRLPIEQLALISGDVIAPNSVKTYSTLFPLSGEGWHKIRLSFHNVLTAGGTVPNALGSYLYVKNITLRTSRNEVIVACPGMSLYHLNWLMNGVEPMYTIVAAGAGAFNAIIDIPFSLPLLSRKEDLILDSGRYTLIELEITLGTITDFQRTAGTAAVTTTMDMSLFRGKACFEESGKPLALPYIKHLAPFQAVTKGYIDIESADDLALFGFFAHASTLATWGTVGNAYEGTPADCLDDISFQDNIISYLKLLKLGTFQQERSEYSNSRTLVGIYPWIFAREGSIYNSYWTGQKSELKLVIGNGNVGTPTTPQVDLVIFGMREMRD
ncbi:hypothetical protein ES702_06839 [subsurface metagenome]